MDTSANAGSSSSYMHLDNNTGLFDIKQNTNVRRAMASGELSSNLEFLMLFYFQDCDDSKIDDDLDKLLQHIKQEQQNSMVISHNSYFH